MDGGDSWGSSLTAKAMGRTKRAEGYIYFNNHKLFVLSGEESSARRGHRLRGEGMMRTLFAARPISRMRVVAPKPSMKGIVRVHEDQVGRSARTASRSHAAPLAAARMSNLPNLRRR